MSKPVLSNVEGVERPKGTGRPKDTPEIPSTLDWELWLGPAPYRPYHPAYHPFRWRGWWDFGTGALGDMACHILDPVFSALKLQYPTGIEASCSASDESWDKDNFESFPVVSIVHYSFPVLEGMPPVKLHWYDGGLIPERPDELEPGRHLAENGVIFVGDKGKMLSGTYGGSPRIIPEEKMREYKRPPKTIERIPGGSDGHERDWIRACKSGKPACSNFDYAGPMSETVVLGNLAIRFPQQKLEWDGQKMEITNFPEANKYINEPYSTIPVALITWPQERIGSGNLNKWAVFDNLVAWWRLCPGIFSSVSYIPHTRTAQHGRNKQPFRPSHHDLKTQHFPS